MSAEINLNDLRRRMNGAIENLKNEFAGLRTGRASVHLLDPVVVDAYGSKMPLNQVATVSTPESRLISVQIWDKTMVAATEKAIRNAGLGLNPVTDGQTLRIPIPELNEERRAELTKVAGKYAEQARIAIRNVRRDGMDTIKRLEKDSEISQDEQKNYSDQIQKLTDEMIKDVDATTEIKEKEIMQV
ncbi:ribosome recycling factor [Paremcibacter congregatus]|uniref:Ribosome-recycling factor n=1 Tax=Paremcibacter congregatus TaxID=2043170 RepID=A0A2G4YSR9_9PROT|nr:ribosome recycling factor [Paremcibacter congregatus]PHZ85343.1 ribosome recycling factor [Paremcibacter congregatus]QDE27726.1 ribosome recycling factor [Paremcibacter congregatus]